MFEYALAEPTGALVEQRDYLRTLRERHADGPILVAEYPSTGSRGCRLVILGA